MVQEAATKDRRRFERRKSGSLSLVELRVAGERHRGILVDLAEGGLSTVLLSPLRRSAIESAHLRLPRSHRRIEAKTEIAWVDGHSRLGLKFVEADRALQSELRKWLLNPRRPMSRNSDASGIESSSHLEAVLQLLAEEAAVRTNATGAAIAVGSRTRMTCIASVGLAPSVGAELSPDAGVSGRCLRTGGVVLCVDTYSDEDADLESSRELGIRSVLVLPVFSRDELIAVLELLSEESCTFGVQHLRRLETIVALVVEAVEGHKESRPEVGRAPYQAPLPQNAERKPATQNVDEQVPREPAFSHQRFAIFRWRRVEIVAISALLVGTIATATYVTQEWSRRNEAVRAAQPAHTAVSAQINPGKSHPRIYFSATKSSQKTGSPFFVTVKMDGAENIASVPIQIRYDPKRLQLMGVSGGDLLAGDGRNVAIVHRDDPASGTIQVTASRSPDTPGRSGSGILFVLMFMAKSPGRSSLKVEQVAAKNPAMQTIAVDSSQAKMTVVTS